MKTKKTKRANLENSRTIFFQIGMILVLSAILVAFEWKSEVKFTPMILTTKGIETIELDMPITKPEAELPKEVKAPALTFIQVDNDITITDEPLFIDTEADWDDIINLPIFETEETVDNEIFLSPQFMPTFKGQEAKYFRNYIAENVKFPQIALENGIAGTVFISFVIDKDGTLDDIKVTRGVDPLVDQAVIDVIKSSPKWEPGIQSGRYVKVSYSTAIKFQIQNY